MAYLNDKPEDGDCAVIYWKFNFKKVESIRKYRNILVDIDGISMFFIGGW